MLYDWSGKLYIDSVDVFMQYGLVLLKESGINQFLEYPAVKESISHDWPDQHGLDVDLSKRFLQPRQVSLQCGLLALTVDDFWARHNGLINFLIQPGHRRIQYSEFGNKSFYVYYNTVNNFNRLTRLLDENVEKIACKFTLVFIENEPTLDDNDVFIIEETGKFIIT